MSTILLSLRAFLSLPHSHRHWGHWFSLLNANVHYGGFGNWLGLCCWFLGNLRVSLSQLANLRLQLHFVAFLRRQSHSLIWFQVGRLCTPVNWLKHVRILVVIIVGASSSLVLCDSGVRSGLLVLPVTIHLIAGVSFIIRGFLSFHALVLGDSGPVQTTTHVAHICEGLFLTEGLFVKQVVRRCYIIVSVCFNAFNCIVGVEAELI